MKSTALFFDTIFSCKMRNSVVQSTLLLSLFLPYLALAHDARPVVVTINEQVPGAYQYFIVAPDTVERGNFPVIAWPSGCSPETEGASGVALCENTIAGREISLDFPYYNPSLATFFRITTLSGGEATAMLTPSQKYWTVPEKASKGNVAREYLLLGIEHIIGGLDHLLFVLGLLVIARTMKRILWTITGFTLAHSITLSLSSLGLIAVPIVPVEAVIALSIVFLAVEISRQRHDTLTYRYPLIVSFGFGLLHGLGFASALGEIGLVQSEILISLLFFNLGVEVGQIAFILLVSLAILILHRLFRHHIKWEDKAFNKKLDLLAAYVIGIPASFWLIDRVVQFI